MFYSFIYCLLLFLFVYLCVPDFALLRLFSFFSFASLHISLSLLCFISLGVSLYIFFHLNQETFFFLSVGRQRWWMIQAFLHQQKPEAINHFRKAVLNKNLEKKFYLLIWKKNSNSGQLLFLPTHLNKDATFINLAILRNGCSIEAKCTFY